MAITRKNLRETIRRRIRDFYKDKDTLGAAITTTTAASFTATDGTKYVQGVVIEVDDEVMLVTGVSGTAISVLRGYRGSTAATHLNAASVFLVDKFSNFEINATQNEVVVDSFPALFSYVVDETLTTDNDSYEATIPTAISRVSKAFENIGSGTRKEWDEIPLKFQNKTTVHLREYSSTNGATLRLVGISPYSALSSDSDEFSGYDEETEYVILETIARLIDARNIERFEDPHYVSTIKQEGSSMAMLQSLGAYFHSLANKKLDEVRKSKPIQLVGYYD